MLSQMEDTTSRSATASPSASNEGWVTISSRGNRMQATITVPLKTAKQKKGPVLENVFPGNINIFDNDCCRYCNPTSIVKAAAEDRKQVRDTDYRPLQAA